jgi:uncharacterized protein involved in exopolysaccharide biosynthesis
MTDTKMHEARAELATLRAQYEAVRLERDGLLEDVAHLAEQVVAVRKRAEAAEAALHEAKVQAEARYDCHGGPGTTSDACGACNACITRRAEGMQGALATLMTALEAGGAAMDEHYWQRLHTAKRAARAALSAKEPR